MRPIARIAANQRIRARRLEEGNDKRRGISHGISMSNAFNATRIHRAGPFPARWARREAGPGTMT